MRKVTKNYDKPPKVLTGVACENKICRAVVAESCIDSKGKKIYNGYHYSHKKVKEALNKIYHQKCAYCEMRLPSLEVEHYRPKACITKKITDSTGKETIVQDLTHKGYYWLGCEWSNLLFACSSCNGKGAKGNLFPIEGNRVNWCIPFTENGKLDRSELIADQYPLKEEYPLLLNPEIDYPEEHLSFNHLGWIEGLTKKGEVSWRIYNLNRPYLYLCRLKVVNELIELLSAIASDAKVGGYSSAEYRNTLKNAFNKIDYEQKKEEYTFWKWYIFHNFAECVLSRIEAPYRRNIGKAFIMYRQGKL